VTPHVADAEDGLNPGLPQRRNGRLQAVFFSAADGDARAVAAQHPRGFQTEAGGAPGDQGHLPLQQVGSKRTPAGRHER